MNWITLRTYFNQNVGLVGDNPREVVRRCSTSKQDKLKALAEKDGVRG